MVSEAQKRAKKRWIEKNPDKVAAQRRRYRERYPEKVKEMRRRQLDNKFRNNPELIEKLKGQLRNDFNRLTRIMFGDKLPKECKKCGTSQDLQIHHKLYIYPIRIEDLERLCRKHHIEEHQRVKK